MLRQCERARIVFKKNRKKSLTLWHRFGILRAHTETKITSHMRTKTLLLTAALGAASIASSMAQVYSANAVGYVNLSLPAGYSLISNPLIGTNNHLNTILPLPNSADGTVIYRFKPSIQNYGNPIQFIEGFGWYVPDELASFLDLPPGEGVFILPSGPTPLNVTFVGEVPQGNLAHAVPSNFSIQASEVPQALPIGQDNAAGTLQFPAVDGDVVYIFDSSTQSYKEPYGFIEGFGWYSENADNPGPNGPVIPVGTSFFVSKFGASTTWDRQFSVN